MFRKDFANLKRITVLSRTVTVRRQRGYFGSKVEQEIIYNATDSQIRKSLEILNKHKRSVLFKVTEDFKTSTKIGLKRYKHYLVDLGEF